MMVCASPIKRGPNKGQVATGSKAGYKRHRYQDEPACAACLAGNVENTVAWEKANPDNARVSARQRNKRYRDAHQHKIRASKKRWRAANVDYDRDWYAANVELARRRSRQWYEANRERVKASVREWRAANPELVAEHHRRRRAKTAAASIIPFTLDQLAQRMAFWGNKCWMCGGAFEHVDHVKPLSKGGAHILANLRPACAFCNVSKHDQWGGVSTLPHAKGA